MQNKPSNSKGPGFAGFAGIVAGGACFFWLSSHPTSFPVPLIQRLLTTGTGLHVPPFAGIAVGALLATLAVWLPLVLFTDPQAVARKKAAVQSAKAAMAADAERTRLERQERSYRDSAGMVDDYSGEKAKAKQATPKFVLSLIGAGIVILILAQFILSHFR